MYRGTRLLPCAVMMLVGLMVAGCASLRTAETSKEVQRLEDVAFRKGSRADKIIEFSGYEWSLKESSVLVGPGPNLFSGSPENVWVDEQGRLHMKITRSNGKWACSEVVCEAPIGYGTYAFYMASRVDTIDPNVVVGLFTWDDGAYQSQANCEIDIEFSRWTEANAPNSLYSVQPCHGPDDWRRYPERFHAAHMNLSGPLSTHVFTWTPQGVAFASFEGHRHPTPHIIESWSFDANNPPRRAEQGNHISDPVLVPKPGPDTRIRMNLWLVNGDAPRYNQDVEIVVERFEYFPIE